ncbi:hypothetical protein U91I_01399 [alpha proteobacterium U9-1i]|nr:hypothetical protein U91I_01399 [alpha proteobacterium U9-1i]
MSWNDQRIAYAWFINSDGTFSSGRASRGPSGGGAWSANGAHLILKYTNGFRYVGELHQDTFGGTAYLANGQSFGAFSMSRSVGPKSDD